MRLTIYSTEEVVKLDGVIVRMWKGRDDNGAECLVFVHRVAVEETNVLLCAQCDSQLQEQAAPFVIDSGEVIN